MHPLYKQLLDLTNDALIRLATNEFYMVRKDQIIDLTRQISTMEKYYPYLEILQEAEKEFNDYRFEGYYYKPNEKNKGDLILHFTQLNTLAKLIQHEVNWRTPRSRLE
jgi:hypothetical protein